MKRGLNLVLIAVIFYANAVVGQNNQPTETASYSLQQCVQYALQNSRTLANATLDEEIAMAKVGEVRGLGLPQVTLAGQLLRNIEIQKQFIPANAFNPTAPAGEIQALGFGVPYSSNLTGSVSQLLFDGSYIVGLQASRTYVDLARKNTQVTTNTIIQNVSKAYYLAVINLERLTLFDANISRLDSSLKELKALNKAGFAESIDVDRLQVAYNNLLIENEKSVKLVELSGLLLKYQMGMPLTANLSLTQRIKDFEGQGFVADNNTVSYEERSEYSLLLTQKRLNQLDLKSSRFRSFPTLAAFGNLGYNTGSLDFKPFNYKWFNFSFVGLSLSMNLFDGFQRRYKIQGTKLNIEKTENNLKNLEQSIDLQVSQAKINYNNSIKTLGTQKENLALAQKVVAVAQKKYKQGVGSNLEVTTAETSLKETQVNYYNALYETLSSKVDLDFAIGKLK